jgi:electron transfer flavoprotein beta subunit
VPALLGEMLGMPVVTVARAVELVDGSTARVTRVTPDGDETVEVSCPAVVTISNEIGHPRYPTGLRTMKARKIKPRLVSPDSLDLGAGGARPRVTMIRQSMASITGSCEFIEGGSPAAKAQNLIKRLRDERVIE